MTGDHGHDHDHGVGLARAGERHRRRLTIAFVIIGAFFVVEAVAGFAANSLALLSDAGHMHADVIGIGMALAAIGIWILPRTWRLGRRTVRTPLQAAPERIDVEAPHDGCHEVRW